MKKTFDDFISFVKNPILEKDCNPNFLYRLQRFFYFLFFCLVITFTITFFTAMLEGIGLLKMGKHAMDEVMKDSSDLKLFLLAVVFAPVVEESIFRAPLVVFKKPTNFRIAFYTTAILFGYMHIANYEITPNILLFSPILIGPQLIIGFFLGFIRIRFGLLWSIALHASYNGFLLSLYLIAQNAITQI